MGHVPGMHATSNMGWTRFCLSGFSIFIYEGFGRWYQASCYHQHSSIQMNRIKKLGCRIFNLHTHDRPPRASLQPAGCRSIGMGLRGNIWKVRTKFQAKTKGRGAGSIRVMGKELELVTYLCLYIHVSIYIKLELHESCHAALLK